MVHELLRHRFETNGQHQLDLVGKERTGLRGQIVVKQAPESDAWKRGAP